MSNTIVEPVTNEAAGTVSEGGSTAGGPLASLGINPSLFVFQLINFAIVAAIIWYLILKPLTKKLEERQKMIDESIDNSKKIQENLKHSEEKFQEKINEAKTEAGKILEKSSVEADKLAMEIKTKSKTEIDGLVEQAKRNIRAERDEMVMDVKKAAGELVVAALEKVLSEKITDKKDHQLIEEMVKKIK
ncbi:MAG: F0F1 ATP synthase subunit B [Patescibacteria group bacterium]|jgi:F-type H+-transporting ATPase subunit b